MHSNSPRFHTNGQISAIQFGGQPLVSNINRLPFGPVKSATLGSLSLTRSYDQRYQISAIRAGAMQLGYTRDAAGQVTAVTGIEEPVATSATETFTIDPASNRMTAAGTAAATYDASGNLTSDGVRTLTWDALGRLVKVEQNGTVTATYGYDSQNRRIRKTVGGRTVYYHYDLDNQLIAETLADGTTLREYVYLDGEPLALRAYETNPGLYYYLNDHLATPQQLVKPDGTVVWKAAYLPYGQAQVRTATVTNNLRFPGQYFDAETGLHYNWHRFYDPATGRYLSADPIGLEGGMNLYAYVQGNPINRIDPYGLVEWVNPYTYWHDFSGGAGDLYRNYRDMRVANTIGADKYFHCMGHCQAARRGLGGRDASELIGEGRELTDEYLKGDSRSECDTDRRANKQGRDSDHDTPCNQVCGSLRPNGLDPRY